MSQELTGQWPASITRRRLVAGATALGGIALVGPRLARAQESTVTPGTGADTTDTTDTTDATDRSAMAAEQYQDFVAKLAGNLGLTDTASVDTAIRDALKAMIDDQLAAGDISANSATARKTEIDESASPLRLGGRFGGDHDPGGHGAGFGGGRPGDVDDDTTPSDSTGTPEATGATLA